MEQQQEPWLTPQQCAAVFNLSGDYMRRLAETGIVPALKFGIGRSTFRFRVSEVEKAMAKAAEDAAKPLARAKQSKRKRGGA